MSNDVNRSPATDGAGILAELPGELMMWVLIASEILVFGAALIACLAVRAADPAGFAADQARLDQTAAAANTLVLVTSGFFAAAAVHARAVGQRTTARYWLFGAGILGIVFLLVKGLEYASKAALGIGIETSPFYTFYYLITGFHALHVLAGIILLALVAWADSLRNVEAAAAFWHMVDLVWVLLLPIIYILR